eukprot:COSAG01_NODE_7018_length_3391_cov_2.202309_6_plen_71_part_00
MAHSVHRVHRAGATTPPPQHARIPTCASSVPADDHPRARDSTVLSSLGALLQPYWRAVASKWRARRIIKA